MFSTHEIPFKTGFIVHKYEVVTAIYIFTDISHIAELIKITISTFTHSYGRVSDVPLFKSHHDCSVPSTCLYDSTGETVMPTHT
jgi:hypothetical protein